MATLGDVNQRLERIERKIDRICENCGARGREIGELSVRQKSVQNEIDEHKDNHWRLPTFIMGGVGFLITAANFVISIWRDR